MRKYVQLSAGLLVVLLSLNTHAGGWQQPTKVSQFVIEGSSAGERIYVWFETNFNPDSCQDNSGWKRVYGNHEQGKYIFSTILSAKAAGQTIVPSLHGCDDWNRPVVAGVWIK